MMPTSVITGAVIVGDCESSDAPPPWSMALANPKSITFTVPSGRCLIFAGFKSRWMMACSWAASSASAIWRAMNSASSSAIGPAGYPLRQLLTFDQLHDEGTHGAGFLEAVNVCDVRMVEGSERLGFARETCEPFDVACEEIRQDFDRDVAIEPGIARPVHFAHSSGSEDREDLVRAETGAAAEGHRLAADYTGAGAARTGVTP